jgi:alpha-tubulin suppressor-like RCC1 family protein
MGRLDMKKWERSLLMLFCCFVLLALWTVMPADSARVYADGEQGIAQVVGGKGFTVVLKKDGTVWTWGDNVRGKLGGGLENRTRPSQVKQLSDVIAVATGGFHTLALKKDGTVWSWGENTYGQLGDGTTFDHNVPTQVTGLKEVTAISAGYYHSVALKDDGTVWSWGDNSKGQLGDAGSSKQLAPVQVKNLYDIKSIASGAYHSLALTNKGEIWAWGDNYYGQLGNGYDKNTINSPVMVRYIDKVMQIASGFNFSMALQEDGSVWSWGINDVGQLGNGDTQEETTPVWHSSLKDVSAISAGKSHAAALQKDGTVYTWGDNSFGQLGVPANENVRKDYHVIPDQVADLKNINSIGMGLDFSFAVNQDGTLSAWGNNLFGQLGDGTTTPQFVPVLAKQFNASLSPPPIPGKGQVLISSIKPVPVAAGDASVLAIKNDRLFVWGENGFGQLGNGSSTSRLTPESIDAVPNLTAVAAGTSHSLAITKDGALWSAGLNYFGQLGDGSMENRSEWKQVSSIINAVAADAGNSHSIVLLNNGTVWTFGDNTYGQLGDDSTSVIRAEPGIVSDLSNIIAVAAGYNFSLALQNDGTVWSWGDNSDGQLGDGTLGAKHHPVQVNGLTGIIAIAAGKNHSLALRNDGTVWSWGYNSSGQLGEGTTVNRTMPQQVKGLSGVSAISGGGFHSSALKMDGTVWTWGLNSFGQLGDGTVVSQSSPIQVKSITDAAYISAGSTYNVAVKKDGTVWAWGANYSGQLADGTWKNEAIPTLITGFSPKFSDLNGHWAEKAVYAAAEEGYVDGYQDGTFKPDNQITRGEFVKMVSSALQLQTASPSDNEAWYQPYNRALQTAGIEQSGDLIGDWNQPLTRKEMAAIALRAVDSALQKDNTVLDSGYVWYTSIQKGIIQGTADGQINPDETTTRGQSVTVLERILALRQGKTLSVDQQALQNAEANYKK